MPKLDGEKAIHIFIPEPWHEWLRERAFRDRSSIAELVRAALQATYPELPAIPEPDQGRKGGLVYGQAAHGSSLLADGSGLPADRSADR